MRAEKWKTQKGLREAPFDTNERMRTSSIQALAAFACLCHPFSREYR